jgi:hypothetical protein
MGEPVSKPPENEVRAVQGQKPAPLLATLVVGLLLGAGLGPALFVAIDRLQLSGDILLSFAIGAFLSLGLCLALVVVGAFLILPRIFSVARGTLAGVVEDLSQASRAHAQGDTDKALEHLGRAVGEGAAWYSAAATRRFAAQAALGLLISFGGSIGAILLLNQNALLLDQNKKIDKQNDIADAQKRSAFVTEMFSILQEVAKTPHPNGELPKELVARILVLTISAVPYRYLSRAGPSEESVVLSPERGQLLLALARMNVKLSSLEEAGVEFDSSDLRGLDLSLVDFSEMTLTGCDFSFSSLKEARFVKAELLLPHFNKATLLGVDFSGAKLQIVNFNDAQFLGTKFDGAFLSTVEFKDGAVIETSFEGAGYYNLRFQDVRVMRTPSAPTGLPTGLPWPSAILKAFEAIPPNTAFKLSYSFEGKPATK